MKKRLRVSSSTKPTTRSRSRLASRSGLKIGSSGVGAVGHGRHQVLQHVAGQRELGEDQQVGAGAAGLVDKFQVLVQVGLHIAQAGIDLRHPQRELHPIFLPRKYSPLSASMKAGVPGQVRVLPAGRRPCTARPGPGLRLRKSWQSPYPGVDLVRRRRLPQQ